jgi:hypothetical protein
MIEFNGTNKFVPCQPSSHMNGGDFQYYKHFQYYKGSGLVQDPTFVGVSTPFNVPIALIFFCITIRNNSKVPIVGLDMDVETLISIRLKLVVIRDAIRPNISTTPKDIKVDVRVDVVTLALGSQPR